MKRIGRHLAFYSFLLLLWSLVAKLELWPPYVFPAPWEVAQSLAAGFADRSFLIAIGVSMKRMAVGYGLSIILGLLLGMLVAGSKFLDYTVGGLLVSLQSLPSICWLPLAVLWFGLTEKAILFVVVMGSVLSITISIESGRKQIPRIYSMAGRNLGARGLGLFFFVLLPASLPYIVSGLKQGWAFAWRSLVAGEMIFVSLGLGQLLMLGRDLNDMSQVLAVMFLIVAIGAIVDRAVFRTIEQQLRRKWGLAAA
ncbi:MAG TPA: ABC transporter permease [Terriglobales bacterium]|jgi:NitT/TauT family transport system permease protein|nr:ABC transporter permease [Terriglobales bacterium]